MYRQFARILDAFKIPDSDSKQPVLDVSKEVKLAQELGAKSKEFTEFKKVPKLPDEFDEEEVSSLSIYGVLCKWNFNFLLNRIFIKFQPQYSKIEHY